MFGRKKSKNLFEITDDAVGRKFAQASVDYLRRQGHWESEVRLDEIAQWGFSQDDGIFTLEDEAGSIQSFNAQIIGSYLGRKREWEWGWNNPNVPSELSLASTELRDFGAENQVGFLTQGQIQIPDEKTLVFLVSICVGLTDLLAAYPADAGEIVVFLGIQNEL